MVGSHWQQAEQTVLQARDDTPAWLQVPFRLLDMIKKIDWTGPLMGTTLVVEPEDIPVARCYFRITSWQQSGPDRPALLPDRPAASRRAKCPSPGHGLLPIDSCDLDIKARPTMGLTSLNPGQYTS